MQSPLRICDQLPRIYISTLSARPQVNQSSRHQLEFDFLMPLALCQQTGKRERELNLKAVRGLGEVAMESGITRMQEVEVWTKIRV